MADDQRDSEAAEGHEADDSDVGIEREATLTQADLVSAVRYLPGAQRPWLMPALLAVVLLVLNSFNPLPTLLAALPAALIAGLLFFTHGSTQRAWVKRAYSELGGVPTTFRFDDFGLSVGSSLRQHRLAWATLVRQLETPDSFLVYTSPHALLVLPKRAFDRDEVDQIRDLLRARVVQRGVPTARSPLVRTVTLWTVLVVSFLAIWQWLGERNPLHREHQANRIVASPGVHAGGGEGSDTDDGDAATDTDRGEASDVDSSP